MQRYRLLMLLFAHWCCLIATLLLRILRISILREFCRQIGKKVAIQNFRDALQKLGVKTLFLKNTINIRAVARQFPGQPADASLLGLEFGFDQFSEMGSFHGAIVRFVGRWWATKKAQLLLCAPDLLDKALVCPKSKYGKAVCALDGYKPNFDLLFWDFNKFTRFNRAKSIFLL